MKRTLLLVCFFICTSIFAAFPITETKNINSISVAAELPVSGVDGVATTSMILAGIAVFFNIILLTSSGLGWGLYFF